MGVTRSRSPNGVRARHGPTVRANEAWILDEAVVGGVITSWRRRNHDYIDIDIDIDIDNENNTTHKRQKTKDKTKKTNGRDVLVRAPCGPRWCTAPYQPDPATREGDFAGA